MRINRRLVNVLEVKHGMSCRTCVLKCEHSGREDYRYASSITIQRYMEVMVARYVPIVVDKCRERVSELDSHICMNEDSEFYKHSCPDGEFRLGCPYYHEKYYGNWRYVHQHNRV